MTVDTRPTAQEINLDGRRVIRLKAGPYLIGHFRDIPTLLAAAADYGVDVADLEIIPSTTERKP